MIFGHIAHSNFTSFHPVIQKALHYLKTTDLDALAAGQYTIDDLFVVQVIDMSTKPIAENLPEVHRNKIDIQYLHSGKEKIGISTDNGRNQPAGDYIPARDIQFYETSHHEFFITMIPGSFAMFYPEDVHRPACIDGEPTAIRKIVVKIELNQLN